MIEEQIEELIDLAEKKYELLEHMHDITRTQLKGIEDGDMDGLNRILDRKDGLMRRIDDLDLSFMDIFSEIKGYGGIEDIYELSPVEYPNLEKLKGVVGRISTKLEAIKALDDENRRNMGETLDGIKAELRKVRKGQEAYRGYNAPIVDNIFIDEKK